MCVRICVCVHRKDKCVGVCVCVQVYYFRSEMIYFWDRTAVTYKQLLSQQQLVLVVVCVCVCVCRCVCVCVSLCLSVGFCTS